MDAEAEDAFPELRESEIDEIDLLVVLGIGAWALGAAEGAPTQVLTHHEVPPVTATFRRLRAAHRAGRLRFDTTARIFWGSAQSSLDRASVQVVTSAEADVGRNSSTASSRSPQSVAGVAASSRAEPADATQAAGSLN